MFDRLSSLAVALTLIVVAIIFASLAGGDALSIAILALAGGIGAVTVYTAIAPAAPAVIADHSPPPEPARISLLRHPDFAQWVDQEKEPLIGTAGLKPTMSGPCSSRSGE